MPGVRSHRGDIYGEVSSIKDIRQIDREIRREMDHVTSRPQLTELKKRADYLCTLTYSPSWRRKFGDRVIRLREVAEEEERKTMDHANEIARKHGWPANYHPWGGRKS